MSEHPGVAQRPQGRRWRIDLDPGVCAFLGLLVISVVALVAAPWPLTTKLYAVVHGLCAQRPSHSFFLGGTALPFDARMTGIYGATLITLLFLLARGRSRAIRLPQRAILIALVLFVVLMGLDGINSTLQDIRLPYAYEPNNWLRLGTGLLMGVSLGVTLLYLVNSTVWASHTPTPIVRDWREVAALLGLLAGFAALIGSGWGLLYTPIALTLVTGAVVTVLSLALSLLLLIYGRENKAHRHADVAGFASVALLLGFAAMALIAVGRWYLEFSLGLVLPI